MELSVSSETTFFNMKLQLEICPQLRTGSSAEDTGRIDTRALRVVPMSLQNFFTSEDICSPDISATKESGAPIFLENWQIA